MDRRRNQDSRDKTDGQLEGTRIPSVINRRAVFEQDLDEIMLLFKRLFNKPTNRKLWEWKYLPPWVGESYTWISAVGGQMVGHVGTVPLRGQIKGEETIFFQVGDVMADPAYRSLNTYRQIVPDEVARDLIRRYPKAILYGFTSNELSLWYTWVISIGRSTFIEPAKDRILHFSPKDRTDEENDLFEYREWPWDAPELSMIWSELRDTIRVGLVRDRLFLQWRYAEHPVFKYSLFGVYYKSRPTGWIVTIKRDLSDKWDDEVRIQDCLLPPELLLPVLQHAAAALRAKSLVFWLPSADLPRDVESRDTGWRVGYYSLAKDVSQKYLANRAFYTLGEADEWWW